MIKQRIWRIAVGLLVLCVLIIAWRVVPTFSSTALPGTMETGVGFDPLTTDEADLAMALAQETNRTLFQAAQLDPATPTIEVLAVERYDAPKASAAKSDSAAFVPGGRSGEVYLYDYTTDTLIHTVVDLEQKQTWREELQGVQLPLTVREEARAVQIVRSDSKLWPTLASRYATITGEALTSTEQLQVKVSLFLSDTMPEQVNAAARQCGAERCAQLLLFTTTERTVLEILPIVSLSQGRVVQLLSDSWTTHQGDGAEGSGS